MLGFLFTSLSLLPCTCCTWCDPAAAAKKAPPAKKAAAGSGAKPKAKPAAKHTNKKDKLDFEMSEGEDDDDSSSDDDVPLRSARPRLERVL